MCLLPLFICGCRLLVRIKLCDEHLCRPLICHRSLTRPRLLVWQLQQVGNIAYFPLSRVGFAQQFSSASGVISTAGFETACEALSQGKHLLVRPLAGQFEQQANARCLSAYGLASVMHELNRDALAQWLVASNERGARQLRWPNVAKRVAGWLAEGAEQPIHELSRSLWNDAELNDYLDLLKRG